MGILAFMCSMFGCGRAKSPDTKTPDTQTETPGGGGPVPSGAVGDEGAGDSAVVNESGIVDFYYSYNATIGADSYSYHVEKTDDGITFTYEGMEDWQYGEMTAEVGEDILDRLEELYRSCNIVRWDGFNMDNPDMLDGDGFSLGLVFADDTLLTAHGSNAYPSGYQDFVSKMREILEPIKDEVKEEKRQEKIKEGLHGTLDTILFTIIQKGKSGRDEYHVLIMAEGYRETNYDVRVKSVSGEFFPEGEYNVHRHVPNEVLNLEKVQELVEKYDLIEWYDFEKTAEDYSNAEWYQIDLGFGDEMDISSMGTVYPEHYKEFRKEFLTWLKETADAVDALGE